MQTPQVPAQFKKFVSEMQTRRQAHQQAAYRKFERTVNYLLNEAIPSLPQVPLTLTTDPGSRVPTGTGKSLSDKVDILYRCDGSESKPDAILAGTSPDHKGSKFTIVVDAKFYSTELPEVVVEKTLDDMALRQTPYGVLICSEKTKHGEFDAMPADKKGDLRMVVLKANEEAADPTSKYATEYMTRENQLLVNQVVGELVADWKSQLKEVRYRQLFPTQDDSARSSTQSTQLDDIPQMSRRSSFEDPSQRDTDLLSFKEKKAAPQKPKTEFERQIDQLFDEVQRDGIEAVAARHSLKLTQSSKLDKRTKIGRVLQPMLDLAASEPKKDLRLSAEAVGGKKSPREEAKVPQSLRPSDEPEGLASRESEDDDEDWESVDSEGKSKLVGGICEPEGDSDGSFHSDGDDSGEVQPMLNSKVYQQHAQHSGVVTRAKAKAQKAISGEQGTVF